MSTKGIIVAIATGAVTIAAGVTIGITVTNPPSRTTSSPTGLTTDCSVDMTSALNTYFSTTIAQSNIDVTMPANACLLVSNSPTDKLLIQSLTNATINWNGDTLEQTSYPCDGSNPDQEIMSVEGNTNLVVENLTVKGPVTPGGAYNCQGNNGSAENDAGIVVGQNVGGGNNGVTFDHVTIENLDGDGLEVYPHQATDTDTNHNIVFENGVMSNWGWFGVVPEGVDGLNITGNTLIGGAFLDAEVDTSCMTGNWYGDCLNTDGTIKGAGVYDMAIVNNTFNLTGPVLDSQANNGPGCTPEKNWTIAGNDFGAQNPGSRLSQPSSSIGVDGSYGLAHCPTDNQGLTITGNTGGTTQDAKGNGTASVYAIAGWSNITIANNHIGVWDGVAGFQQSSTNVTVNGTSLTDVAGTMNFSAEDVGLGFYSISGATLPSGDTIASVQSATQATLATAATTNGTNVSMTVAVAAYEANMPTIQAIGLCQDNNATVKSNTFDNASGSTGGTPINGTGCIASNYYTGATTNTVECGNTWGLTEPVQWMDGNLVFHPAPAASPLTDAAC